MRRTHNLIAAIAALPVLLTGTACAPVALGSVAIVVNEEFTEKSHSKVVAGDVELVWASSKSSMSHMTDDLLDVDEELKTIRTFVDGAEVMLKITNFDVGQTQISVYARRYLVFSDEVAGNVLHSIVRDLG